MSEPLGRIDYEKFCMLLSIAPDLSLPPSARAATLPSGTCNELLATPHAVERLKAWMAAGSPTLDMVDVVRALRFAGSPATHELFAEYLASGAMAPAAAYFVANRVAVFAVGRDARGLAVMPPAADLDRVVLVNDRDITDEEVRSVFIHEAAHAWLDPPRPTTLSRVEESLYATDTGIRLLAAQRGFEEQLLEGMIRGEYRTCVLAKIWGATGASIDGDFCSAHLRAELFEVRTEKERRRQIGTKGPGDEVR